MSRSAFGSVYCRAHGRSCTGGRTRCSFYWRYRLNGEDVVRWAGPDREVALDGLAAARLKIAKEEALGIKIPDRVTFSDFRPKYETYLRTNSKPGSKWPGVSLKQYEVMEERIGKIVLLDLDASRIEDLKTWLLGQDLSNATVNRYLATLSGVMSFAVTRNVAQFNPVSAVEALPEKRRPVPWVELTRLRRIESQAESEEARVFVVVGIETGAREGSIAALEWQDARFEAGTLVFRTVKDRDGDPLEVPMSTYLRATLEGFRAAAAPVPMKGPHPMFPTLDPARVSRRFPTWCKDAGIERLRFHDLRHCMASRLRRANLDDDTILKIMGWKSRRMLDRYASHAPDDATRQGMRRLEEVEGLAEVKRRRKKA